MFVVALTGLARNTTPNRSMSYLGAAACIISTAQHARPKVIGQREPCASMCVDVSGWKGAEERRGDGFFCLLEVHVIIYAVTQKLSLAPCPSLPPPLLPPSPPPPNTHALTFLAQFTTSSSLVTTNSAAWSNFPREAGVGAGETSVCWLR